jgi:hypothetical protein
VFTLVFAEKCHMRSGFLAMELVENVVDFLGILSFQRNQISPSTMLSTSHHKIPTEETSKSTNYF